MIQHETYKKTRLKPAEYQKTYKKSRYERTTPVVVYPFVRPYASHSV